MTMAPKKYPDFFKVFLPGHNSERLHIPNAFVAHLRGRVPKEVILTNRIGRVWHVKTQCIGGQIYFEQGWKEFTEENSLEAANFVVFTYDGGKVFKFKIFEQSGCKKIEVKEEEELEEKDYVMEMEEEEEDDDKDNDDDDEYGCTPCEAPISSQRETAGSSATKAENPKHNDYEVDAEKYVQLGNPCFVAKLCGNRYNELHIPSTIIKDFDLRLPQTITLCLCCRYIERDVLQDYHFSLPEQTLIRNPCMMLEGKVYRWKDHRVCIRGWAIFCRRNRISKDDACICEFKLGEDQKIEMLRVHVVRKG